MQAMRNRHPLNGNTYPTRPLLKHNSRSKLGGGWETKARLTAHVKLTASLEVNHLSPTACLGSMVQSGNSNSQIQGSKWTASICHSHPLPGKHGEPRLQAITNHCWLISLHSSNILHIHELNQHQLMRAGAFNRKGYVKHTY